MLTNSCFLTPIFVKVILSLRHIIHVYTSYSLTRTIISPSKVTAMTSILSSSICHLTKAI
nr:MAG TPA: hypothetical protein [Caudoviricetes sp.]